jgi:ribonuclease I
MNILLFLGTIISASGSIMQCGKAPYCGILALSRGGGEGVYDHEVPTIHGLWPETGRYGTSECVTHPDHEPGVQNSVFKHTSCYESTTDRDLSFKKHEWVKHGHCAALDPDAYFSMACELAQKPLQIMAYLKKDNYNIHAMARALAKWNPDYDVVNINAYSDELHLSVCAGKDGKWVLAPVDKFDSVCGGGK